MINDDEDRHVEEVTAATMRRLRFERIEDDYYIGGGAVGGEEAIDSDDDASSDDEVKSTLRKLAGYQEKSPSTRDAFGRRRRRSEFEDEMDDELDRSITEYASEHMVGANRVEEIENEEECRKADEAWHRENAEIEQKMAHLELLPYDVDLTDSEVDPEMPAAVVKDEKGEPVKLIYSCKRGEELDIEERRKRQKERRARVAASRQPEKLRRQMMIKTMVDSFSKDGGETKRKMKKEFSAENPEQTPLSSILKKRAKKTPEKEEKMEEEEEEDSKEKEPENPIKKALEERMKEIEKNDELLYDDEEDDDNERWVKEMRKQTRGEDAMDDEADGVLSCPGCMVELTRDCQRHEIYKTQYRAMFVSNCRLDDQKLTVEKTGKAKRREKQKAKKSEMTGVVPPGLDENDLFTPVKCASCGTLVAMMDSDEIYHFFNVLSGYS